MLFAIPAVLSAVFLAVAAHLNAFSPPLAALILAYTFLPVAVAYLARDTPPPTWLDFVVIVTPNHQHFAPAKLFLEAGFNVVCDKPLTFDLILSSFYTIWVKAEPEEHMARVRGQGDLRPMADDRSAMAELRNILLSREPLYARASAVVDTAGPLWSPRTVANSVAVTER